MTLQEIILERIRHSATDCFSTMLGAELTAGEAYTGRSPEVNDGVVSLIGLAGAWVGTGSVSCTPASACKICELMLMTETPAVTDDVLDAVAEITNIVIGSVKNDLEAYVGPLGLSIPTVVYGRNFQARSAASSEWNVVRFHWDGEELVVRLFLAPADKAPHPTVHLAGQSCSLEG